MKVIFLDIDGVMNSIESNDRAKKLRESGQNVPRLFEEFAPWSVAALNEITDRTCAKIVISSTWRESAVPHLRRAGARGDIIGATPRLERYQGTIYLGITRGQEIAAWLKHEAARPCGPQVCQFVILDDDADMGDLLPRLVRTDPYTRGLTQEHAGRAIALLNREMAPTGALGEQNVQ